MKRAMTLAEAEQLLQLPPVYDDDTVRFCYGRAMRADHPDHGGTGARLTLIRDARNLVLEPKAAQHEEIACKLCKGSGKVRSKFGVRACVACDGTGDRR